MRKSDPVPHSPPRAQSLSPYVTSDSGAVQKLVERAFQNGVKGQYQRLGSRRINSVLSHIRCVILSAVEAYLQDPESPGVSYSRDHNAYPIGSLSYDTLITKVMPGLVAAGYVVCHNKTRRDWMESDDDSRPSCYQPGLRLIDEIAELGIDSSMLRHEIPNDLVVFKGPKITKRPPKSGKRAKFAPRVKPPGAKAVEKQWKQTQRLLRHVNGLLDEAFVGYFVPDAVIAKQRQWQARMRQLNDRAPTINVFRKHLYRIFNDVRPSDVSLQYGGRFYGGWWQSIPREYRHANIWIENAFAVELDFRGMEPTIAYALRKHDVSKYFRDPYTIDGLPKEARHVIKTAFLVSINSGADTPRVAARKVRAALYKDFASKVLRDNPRADIPPQKQIANDLLLWPGAPPLVEIVRKVFSVHDRVLPADKQEGNRRMFWESRVTEYVLTKMLRAGIFVLPVHDSFLVHPKHGDRLLDAMGEGLMSTLGEFAPIRTVRYKLEAPSIGSGFLRHGNEYLGPSPKHDWVPRSPASAYPWNVDRSDYSLFFNSWAGTGRDVDREVARSQEMDEQRS